MNQAQKRAKDQARGLLALRKGGFKVNPPAGFPMLCDGLIRPAKNSTFDFWVKAPTLPWIPCKSHRALNKMLGKGKLRDHCEIRQDRQGNWFVRVFVEIEVSEAKDTGKYLGCDVGVNNGVARSDGYLSKSLRPVMAQHRQRNAERRRQGHLHKLKSNRTSLKQFLDVEARKAVTFAAERGLTIVIERLKTLSNLKPRGRIGGWARRHFGDRVLQIAEILGVPVLQVWAAHSSQECLNCGCRDRKNRTGKCFRCVRCLFKTDSDIGASRVLTVRAHV